MKSLDAVENIIDFYFDNFNEESHSKGRNHDKFITIKKLIIKIVQHEYREVMKILLKVGGNIILERGLIEKQLNYIKAFKKSKLIT